MTYVAIGTKIPRENPFPRSGWTTMCARLRSMSSMAILQQLARLKKSRPRARVAIRHQDRHSEESCSETAYQKENFYRKIRILPFSWSCSGMASRIYRKPPAYLLGAGEFVERNYFCAVEHVLATCSTLVTLN